MATKKISELNALTTPENDDILAIVDTSATETKKITYENISKHILNVGTEVEEDCRVNLISSRNLCDGVNQSVFLTSAVNQGQILSGNTGLYIKVKGGNYTISTTTSQSRYRVACMSSEPSDTFQTAYNGVNKDGTSDTITIDTTGYCYLIVNATDLTKLQIEKGSTATTYSPFIPNQIVVDNETFADTLNVGASVDGRSRVNVLTSKNLFDANKVLNGMGIASNGTITSATDNGLFYMPIIVGKTYVFSFTDNGVSGNIVWGYTSQVPANGVSCTYNVMTNANLNGATFTPTGTQKYLCVRLNTTSNTQYNAMSNIQCEEGNTPTTYEPYITPSIYVDNDEIYSKPVVLWTNPSPTSDFASQTITLNDSLANYSFYEVIYKTYKDENIGLNSSKIPTSMGTTLFGGFNATDGGVRNRNRAIVIASNTTMDIGNTNAINTSNNTYTATDNGRLVPYQIIGYK